MGAIASQITNLTIVYSTVYSDAEQRKHQSSASLAFMWGNSPGTGEFPAQMASDAENVSIFITSSCDTIFVKYLMCLRLTWQWKLKTQSIPSWYFQLNICRFAMDTFYILQVYSGITEYRKQMIWYRIYSIFCIYINNVPYKPYTRFCRSLFRCDYINCCFFSYSAKLQLKYLKLRHYRWSDPEIYG